MKWLITGGCGFLGSALIRNLKSEHGHQIRVVDNLSVGKPDSLSGLLYTVHENLPAINPAWDDENIQIFVADIEDDAAALLLAAGADVIVHLAANTGVQPSVQNPRKDCITNVIGTFNYLDAARINGVKRFVFASSGAPVGEVTPPIHEEIVPHPVSPYGASKLCGEAYCSAFFKTYGVETVGLRFGNVYGPGSAHKSSVVARFLSTMMAGGTLTIYGDGTQTRDFIHIEDLIRAIRAAAVVPGVGGEMFQIATSQETQVIEIAEMLREIATRHGVPFPEIVSSGRLPGDVMRNYSDTSKALRVLGWRPNRTLKEGLEQTFLWFNKQKDH